MDTTNPWVSPSLFNAATMIHGMGILDRFKKSARSVAETTTVVAEAPPPEQIETPDVIPRLDVFLGTMEPNPEDPKHARWFPESLAPQDGPLGAELPYQIMTDGFRAPMKNVRPGVELELTLAMNKEAYGYPQIHVFRGDKCMGLLEIYRAEWFAPAVRLAEKYGVAMTMSGITANDRFDIRVEPFIFLPDPQMLYDVVRSALLAKLAAE
jgi:hypothetical protein